MKRIYVLLAIVPVFLFAVLGSPSLSEASTTAVLTPTSDGNYLQLLTSSGSTHYTLVDETPCNGITDYTFTSTTTKQDSYGVSLSSIGNGASISKIAIVPCASRNASGGGSSTLDLFYRYNGADSSTTGSYALAANTTPSQLATSTYSNVNLFKTSTSTLEIGAVYSSGTKGIRLSRMATVLTYTVTVPTAPSGLFATNISSTENDLTWTDNSSNELGFKIYRALNGGSYSQVATTTTWNIQSYNDTGLTADQTYSYEVVAYNAAGTATSNVSTAITYNTTPSAPSSLTAASSSNSVLLTWTDNSTNEDGFKIERGTDNVNFSQIATMTINFASTTSYTDSTITPGTTYYYRVRAYNAVGNSSYSGSVPNLGVVTVPNGTVISSTTSWNPFFIYVIEGSLTVDSGGRLNISPGTFVKFQTFSSILEVSNSGVLDAEGSAVSPIHFTSYKDDTVGGDTNGNGGATSPAAQDWDTIKFDAGSSSTLAYATVRYGGYIASARSQANLDMTGGTLTLRSATSSDAYTYGVFMNSGTTTITSSDLGNQRFGIEQTGGSLTIASSVIHDNYGAGVELINTSPTISSSDIYTNAIGFDIAGAAAPTISENAMHGNTTYGLNNTTGVALTADNNWWGTWKSPGACDPENGVCSDSTSTLVTVNTWHHNQGYWAVRTSVLIWHSTSQYSNELNVATSTWNSVAAGAGIISVSSSSASSTGILNIFDYTDSSAEGQNTCGKTSNYFTASSLLDTIKFNTYCMDTVLFNVFGDNQSTAKIHVATHEMGHALGLGHSDPLTEELMYSSTNLLTTLAAADQSDYSFLWNTMRWATSRWWPK